MRGTWCAGADAAVGRAARPGADGVVVRPRLFGRLGTSARVTVVSAPPGSGKTVLLRSWIGEAGLSGRAAWVPAGRGERDPQQFWLLVLGALRQTAPGLELVQPGTAAPDLDGWMSGRVVRASSRAASPLDRVGVADDIAPAALFLACDDSRYVTGINLVVDGGQSLGIGLSFGKTASFPERRGTYDHDTDHRIE